MIMLYSQKILPNLELAIGADRSGGEDISRGFKHHQFSTVLKTDYETYKEELSG